MTQTRTLIRKLLLPFGVVGLVVTAGVISNLVTAAVYRKNLIASGARDSAMSTHYHAFDDLGAIPDSFIGSRMDVAVAIPFYVQVCLTFSDGPNLGDQFRSGRLTCFGAHIEIWGEY